MDMNSSVTGRQGYGNMGKSSCSFLFYFVSFSLLSRLPARPIDSTALHGDTKSEQGMQGKREKKTGPARSTVLAHLGTKARGTLFPRDQPWKAVPVARISAEGVGRPLT